MLEIDRDHNGKYIIKACGQTYRYSTYEVAKRRLPKIEEKWRAILEEKNNIYYNKLNEESDRIKAQLKEARRKHFDNVQKIGKYSS